LVTQKMEIYKRRGGMIKVAVVILNWNGKNYLEKFLPDVVKNTPGENFEIWVADNGSADGSIPYVMENHPEVKILELGQNYGFAGGYVKALDMISAGYYVLLNSDAKTSPGWLEPLIRLMESDTSIAACQPKIKSLEDSGYFEYAGAAGGFIDFLGYPFCRGRIFDVTEKDTGQYDSTCRIFWASGACMVVRGDLWHENSGFDEKFFAHMEEIDFCWRLKNRGYKIMVCHESQVFHLGGGTLEQASPRKTFLNFRNNLLLLYKNLPSKQMPWVLLLRLEMDMLSVLKFLFSLSFSNAFAVIKAHFAFFFLLPSYSKIRKKLQKERKVDLHPQIYRKSIVADFFIRGKRYFSSLNFGK